MDRRSALAEYLQSHHVMTIATAGERDPWAAAVFYVNEDFEFYFLSAPGSRHALDATRNPRAAVTIQDDCHDWQSIQGVQMSATIAMVGEGELDKVQRLYDRKFPGILDGTAVPAAISAALVAAGWYRLRAESVRFIDNSLGFGHRDEWQVAGGMK